MFDIVLFLINNFYLDKMTVNKMQPKFQLGDEVESMLRLCSIYIALEIRLTLSVETYTAA